MEKLKLTRVNRTTSDKEGNALKTKDNRPYTRLSIKTEQYPDKWISGFDGPTTKDWKVGDEVEAEVVPNGEYLNLKIPKKDTQNNAEVLEMLVGIKLAIGGLKNDVARILDRLDSKGKVEYPTRESEGLSDHVPFDDGPEF